MLVVSRSLMKPVAIIVLNWNGWRDTAQCLVTLRRLSYGNFRVIVVDNGSTDDSVQQIQHIWLLNNDTTVDSRALGAMVDKAEADPKIGAVGSVIYSAGEPERLLAWG